MIVSLYDPNTGEITGTLINSDREKLLQELAGQSWIEGDWDGRVYRVVNRQSQLIPPAPAANHAADIWRFDHAAGEWQRDTRKSAQQVRHIRNESLQAVDRVNTVWYANLSADQQSELQQYRQALLDIPQQTGFPAQIEWPVKPGWL